MTRQGVDRYEMASPNELVRLLAPLFWDAELAAVHLEEFPEWVVRRVLMFGCRPQVEAVRLYYGDDLLRRSVAHREVDERTRRYWQVVLPPPEHENAGGDAPAGP